ncbi:guanine nucleotide-binding protein subunit alpha [Chytriomyces hyalinus]|nr:guanine nucleotide-binding protein subunit alpha [Chytriomyces hyalinus]
MGCSSSTHDDAFSTSREIDRRLNADSQVSRKTTAKLLLLGTGETGKSTVLKQMKLIYGAGITIEERQACRSAIILNICTSIKALVLAMETCKIPYGFESNIADMSEAALAEMETSNNLLSEGDRKNPVEVYARYLHEKVGGLSGQNGPVPDAARYVMNLDSIIAFSNYGVIPAEATAAIKSLWRDSGIQYCFKRSNEFQLTDSCPYFLNDLDRIGQDDYLPTEQDVLNARIKTTKITETVFKVDKVTYRVFDVAGQRCHRKHWAPYFDDVNSIIFMVAISSYDQVCMEDETSNRVVDSKEVFAALCNHPLFKRTPMILFMNKIDLFKEKLKFTQVSQYFEEYDGPNDYESASEFFVNEFLKVNKYPKNIYRHLTAATDTQQIKGILDAVQAIIKSLDNIWIDNETGEVAMANKEIERQISKDRQELQKQVKLLLLGSGETGKSTILKQFRLIYGPGFTQEKAQFRCPIVFGISTAAKTLVRAMSQLNIPYGFDPSNNIISHLPPVDPIQSKSSDAVSSNSQVSDHSVLKLNSSREEIAKHVANLHATIGPFLPSSNALLPSAVETIKSFDTILGFRNYASLTHEAADAVKLLWADTGVQYCWTRRSEFHIADTAAYFLNDLTRFCTDDFETTDQDILNTRIVTTSVTETRFEVENLLFRVFDVGGQRGERRKWAQYFDDVSALIYVAALGQFDQMCVEDDKTNRVIESINLFGSISSNPIFKQTPIILFMNKTDVFEEKLATRNVSEFFPDFAGRNALKEAGNFFLAKFLMVNKYPEKPIYMYLTCATNTAKIRSVLETVQKIIIKSCLKDTGLA